MHGHGHERKHVFDTTTDFRLATVILFLFLGQGLVAVAFLTDLVTDVLGQFLTHVGTVSVCCLVLLAEEILKLVAIVYVGRGDDVIQNQLAVSIHLGVVFVAVMRFVAFFRPTGIDVLLRHFVRILLPFLWDFAVFDLLVFITAVSLAGRIHKCGIDDRAFMQESEGNTG